ncbi:acetylcholine receptor subunit delta [Trichonephila clavipes]|nr:acetylcholine receptor subunit delta [Trichonephila clavipes]
MDPRDVIYTMTRLRTSSTDHSSRRPPHRKKYMRTANCCTGSKWLLNLLEPYDDNRVPVWRPRGERLNPAFALQRHTAPTAGVMDEVKGEFVFEGIIHFLWTDERLTWESENITGIRVASYQIWTPFIRILNKVAKPEITLRPPPIIFQGGVWWGPRGVFRTACIPNLKYFPFDEHICEVEIVSVSEEVIILWVIWAVRVFDEVMLSNPTPRPSSRPLSSSSLSINLFLIITSVKLQQSMAHLLLLLNPRIFPFGGAESNSNTENYLRKSSKI